MYEILRGPEKVDATKLSKQITGSEPREFQLKLGKDLVFRDFKGNHLYNEHN